MAPFLVHRSLNALIAPCCRCSGTPILSPLRPPCSYCPRRFGESGEKSPPHDVNQALRARNHHFRCGSGVERRHGRPKERGETGRGGSAAGGEERRAGGSGCGGKGQVVEAGVGDKEIWGRSDGCAATVGLHPLAVRAKLVRIAADRRAHCTRTVPAYACAAHDRLPRSQRNLHASHPPRR